MSAKKATTLFELLIEKLSGRPQNSRCVLVVEPDHIVEWPRTTTDMRGRAWEVGIYRGDDVVTRRAWQRVWGGERPVCLVLSRAPGSQSALDASSPGILQNGVRVNACLRDGPALLGVH